MPRRTKPYVGPNKTLVNGGRFEPNEDANEGTPVAALQEVVVDIEGIRKNVAKRIQGFDELAQLENRDQFIKDLADECAWALTMRLDWLTKGTRTKPNEWTTQILARGLATVMARHGLRVAISEYEDSNHTEIRQSLYLRLVRKLCGSWFPIPKDVKGLALRAMRIEHEGVVTAQNKRRSKNAVHTTERFSHKRTKPF